MTTIAYRDGIIASDSKATAGNYVFPGKAQKLIISEKHGCIFAVTGAYNRGVAFLRRLEALPKMPWFLKENISFGASEDFETFSVLIVQWDNRVFNIEEGFYAEILGDFYCLGSGSEAAHAAMLMGADATRAIEIASMVDSATDSRVITYHTSNLCAPAHLSSVRAPSPKPRSRKAPVALSRQVNRTSRKKPA